MTIETLIDGVVDALHTEFGDEYHYLTENNEQDLPAPCFLIKSNYGTRNKYFWRRYYRSYIITIVYFPDAGELPEMFEREKDLNNVADRMFYALELFDANGHKVQGMNKAVEKSDGSLVFTMDVDLYEIAENDAELMEKGAIDVHAVEGSSSYSDLIAHAEFSEKNDQLLYSRPLALDQDVMFDIENEELVMNASNKFMEDVTLYRNLRTGELVAEYEDKRL